MKARYWAALAWILAAAIPLIAHEPLFMASHEAPGKGAFDLHLEVTGDRTEAGDETEYELEGTWGLTRDVAIRFGVPYVVESGSSDMDESALSRGFGDPSVLVKWRFWSRDVLGAKYAVAGFLESTIPVGEEGLGRNRPTVLVGLAHGREGLKHYYFVDARYAYALDDDGDQPGDAFFLDASYGWRPRLRSLEQTDVVYFFEANWEDRAAGSQGGIADLEGSGRFFALAAEALVSPTNRLMIRGGLQIPLHQSLAIEGAPERDVRFRVAIELRF